MEALCIYWAVILRWKRNHFNTKKSQSTFRICRNTIYWKKLTWDMHNHSLTVDTVTLDTGFRPVLFENGVVTVHKVVVEIDGLSLLASHCGVQSLSEIPVECSQVILRLPSPDNQRMRSRQKFQASHMTISSWTDEYRSSTLERVMQSEHYVSSYTAASITWLMDRPVIASVRKEERWCCGRCCCVVLSTYRCKFSIGYGSRDIVTTATKMAWQNVK